MLSTNASLVGVREQSLTDAAPIFPVFVPHVLTLHSVMDVDGAASLAHELSGLSLH